MLTVSCAAVLFDLDGVLINSTPAVERVWRGWAVEHGFDPEAVVRHAHGCPSISTVRDFLPNGDHELENLEVERREIADTEGIVPLPGAVRLLQALPPDRWTIVTSCTRPLAEVRLRAAGLSLPKEFVTASDIVNGKPHPEPYLKGAAMLGFAAENCVVVEDVPAGVRAGKAAGTRVIGLQTSVDASTLRQAGADWVLPSCAHISAVQDERGLRLTLTE
ncbi:MAG TPA: HAD family hydrolase [Candidatus Acidoferrales bacterium]|nr:HAD family hydrolase [Candidatus Acidoferrales bacterium]